VTNLNTNKKEVNFYLELFLFTQV